MSSYSLPPEPWQLVAKNLDVEDLCCFRCAGRLFAATGLLQLRTYYGGTLDNASINCSPETLRSMLAVLGNTGLVKNVHRFGMSIVDLTPDQQLLKHVRLENLRKLVLRAVTLESSGALVLLLKQHARTLVELEMSAVTLSTSRQGPLCFGDTPCMKDARGVESNICTSAKVVEGSSLKAGKRYVVAHGREAVKAAVERYTLYGEVREPGLENSEWARF